MDRLFVRRLVIVLALSATTIILAMTGGWTQTAGPGTRTDPKINEPFKNPDLKGFIKKFESDEREVYAKRKEIVAALELKPGMAIADVGAGTGLFTRLFADVVGPSGKVYAVDVAPSFLKHIAADAAKRGQKQVMTVVGSQDSTNLPPASVDLVFLCDVYHHLETPERNLSSIRRALRERGRLVVIDFDRVEGKSTEFVLKHVRAGQNVFRKEIEAVGFALLPPARLPRLNETFFLQFEKSPSAPKAANPK
jgi:ubiquinone/menaquinone biosynthesis C-methylase UbiE